MRATFQFSFLALIFVSLLLAGCGRNEGSASAAAPGPQALPVKVLKAQAEPVGQFTEYVSALKSRNSSVLQPEVEGQITQIYVSSGERVEPGSPILEIDQRKQQA